MVGHRDSLRQFHRKILRKLDAYVDDVSSEMENIHVHTQVVNDDTDSLSAVDQNHQQAESHAQQAHDHGKCTWVFESL